MSFPTSIRICCWFHRLANIWAKLPDESAVEVVAHLCSVRDAPTLDAARAAADRLANTYRCEFPAAIACFADDLDALLNIHRVPGRRRIRSRTTNLAERSFVEERCRTKVIARFGDEPAADRHQDWVPRFAFDEGAMAVCRPQPRSSSPSRWPIWGGTPRPLAGYGWTSSSSTV